MDELVDERRRDTLVFPWQPVDDEAVVIDLTDDESTFVQDPGRSSTMPENWLG